MAKKSKKFTEERAVGRPPITKLKWTIIFAGVSKASNQMKGWSSG